MIRSKFDSIILIGPLAVGKSTIGYALSDHLGCPNYPIDRLKWYYRFKNGYNLVESKKLLAEEGFGTFLKYAQSYFTPDDLEDVISSFRGVIDLGASDSFADHDPFRLLELERIFRRYKNSFLLLPSQDPDLSKKVLHERLLSRYNGHPIKSCVIDSYIEMNNNFVDSESNQKLAKRIIYTEGKEIVDIVNEIADNCVFSSPVVNINYAKRKRRRRAG